MNVAEFIRSSFSRGTQVSRFNIMAAAALGAPAHLSFYVAYKYIFQLPYDNLALRLVAVALCLVGLFKLKNPDFLGKYFPIYWHSMLIFVLPFILTVMVLKNNFHEAWIYWEIFMIFVLISFVPNPLVFLFDLFLGVGAAIVFFFLTPPFVVLDPQFDIAPYVLLVVFSIVAGYVFSYSNRKGIVAQEKNSAFQALAGSIAHEMRNPLGQVKFSFQSILEELPTYHADKVYECITAQGLDNIYLRVAQGQMAVSRGGQVIDMILDEVKDKPIDTSGFTYLSAEGITKKAIDEYGYESEAERKKLSLECSGDFLIKADETMYVFVLFNLIMNAFYFIKNYPDAHITVCLEKGSSFNRISVRDTGPGIPPENLGRLFDAFFTSGKKGGTGLGLAYCKRVMKAFGGDITCESRQHEYTEFTLEFPVVSGQELVRFRSWMVSRYRDIFEDKSILLVDDELPDREPVKQYLEPFHVIIDEAGNGQEALEMLAKKRYDVVLMNLGMPVMNGYESTEEIRRGKAGATMKNVPIVGHTAVPTYIARGKTEKVGMQAFISKPVTESELINLLASIFNGEYIVGTRDFSGINVMLVDDSSFNRYVLKSILEKHNIGISEAVSGKAAIEKLKLDDIHVILMDIQMPELDGIETTRLIRSSMSGSNKNVPIIGLSGESGEEEIQKALSAGMNDYLLKPVDSVLLLNMIEKWGKS
ncbi:MULTISPECIES: response regulator [Prosthecochloris]|uniref:histidine kinase n=2 Tax=Prosthecochloris TaxID=1101 RepID=A0A317T645_9CHLB|nr:MULTISPECIES: hybrid sensor histidine kinase/response regulator [Prosthecochloris]PWW82078.1 hybrid sensor histidine kinase/response regulator [Prosthecochloris marina]UZJ36761.1 response regulator [Prosthecochloris sp. SCSIO W1103]